MEFCKTLPVPAALAALLLSLAAPADAADVEIPYATHVLDNGLTLVVHEDDKAPIVAVNVWYHVGSKNERRGKTGFAHLFEHLMFNGSENYDGEFFEPFEAVGATSQNGTTNFDRTNYFQNVPTTALDLALWMESDRMGHLLGAVDQETLDEQRGVVQNEKRQRDNQPYGRVYEHVFESVFPYDHPYSWMPIGSLEDLNAANLDDVHEWFRSYYGPNNAVLVVAGDVDTARVIDRVEHYFGDIPPGPPIGKHDIWLPKLDGEHREVLQDRVPQARVYKVWVAPNWAAEDADSLRLVGDLLASGKTSRLYERLVYRDQIATDVSASPFFGEIAGLMIITATAQPGGDLTAVEAAIDEELARFIQRGPSRDELERAQTQARAGFLRSTERIDGFGGKSDILARSLVYGGSPDFYQESLKRIDSATRESLQSAAERWLGTDGRYVLQVLPFPELAATPGGADRSTLPMPETFPDVSFDEFARGELDNGLKLMVATRRAVPIVNMQLVLDAGYAADQFGEPGTSSLALAMLDEGTATRDALQINDELARLGASIGAGSTIDTSFVTLNALSDKLDDALDVYADVILNPAFPDNELTRLKRLRVAQIQREQVTPVSMALRVFPRLLYGEDHAYGLPLTGSGTLDSVARIDRDALAGFHRAWFRPNNATLIVVGDTTIDEITPKLNALFRDWPGAETPRKNVARVELPADEQLYLVDRPGSDQSIIFGGHVIAPTANEREFAIQAMNDILGGEFTARVNMNLREDKNWAYGAYTIIVNTTGQRPFLAYAPVQTDRTADSLAELRREFRAIQGERPPLDEELTRVLNKTVLSLPGRWETASAVANSLAELVRFGLPDDYWRTFSERVRGVTLADVGEAAAEVIEPDRMIWVVVGDRSAVEDDLKALGFDAIRLIDTEGQPAG
ncbi:MAG: pitrilysin family protein [Pseudomonadota bacterium]